MTTITFTMLYLLIVLSFADTAISAMAMGACIGGALAGLIRYAFDDLGDSHESQEPIEMPKRSALPKAA